MGLQQHQIIQQKKHVLKNNAGKKCASYVKKTKKKTRCDATAYLPCLEIYHIFK